MLENQIRAVINETPVTDIHTHLWSPVQKPDQRWGIDGLLNYHYLMTETLRFIDMPYRDYFRLDQKTRAELTWKTLFVDRPPVSESCQGVLQVLSALGLDPNEKDLEKHRKYFAGLELTKHFDRVFQMAGIRSVISTNSPFEDDEILFWKTHGTLTDERIRTSFRLDPLVNLYDRSFPVMRQQGYDVSLTLTEKTQSEIKRFIEDWIRIIRPEYLAVSLAPEFSFSSAEKGARIFRTCVLPVAELTGVPVALMMGVHKKVHSELLEGGDSVGKADIHDLEAVLDEYPHVKFLVTVLSKDNVHELNVAARKFRNLLPFGCWWFLNQPSIVEETTRLRLEMLGTGFVMQHSDATFVDQLIYKWAHTREALANVMIRKDREMEKQGYRLSEEELRYIASRLLGDAFTDFTERGF